MASRISSIACVIGALGMTPLNLTVVAVGLSIVAFIASLIAIKNEERLPDSTVQSYSTFSTPELPHPVYPMESTNLAINTLYLNTFVSIASASNNPSYIAILPLLSSLIILYIPLNVSYIAMISLIGTFFDPVYSGIVSGIVLGFSNGKDSMILHNYF